MNPHNGNLVIHDTEQLVECADKTYPPTSSTCPTFVNAGVTDHRTITQNHAGLVAWVTDVFTSTDGKKHSLDLLWANNQRFHRSTGDSTQVAYKFPGQSAFSTHALKDTVSLPRSAPARILVNMKGAADGDTATGQGAIVYDRPATKATFVTVGSSDSQFTLHQTGKVPAGGSTRFRFAYAQGFTAAGVAKLATLATHTFTNCVVPKVIGKTRDGGEEGDHARCVHGREDPQRLLREGEEGQRDLAAAAGGKEARLPREGLPGRQQGLAEEAPPGARGLSESVAMEPDRCQDAGMSTCRACGQENPEIARFCLACGASLAEETPHREERRIVSVVFVDLVGFTSRSEQLDPEDVRAILTPYHGTVRDELESFGGVVEKFVGDAVMAVFGAPTAHGDDPERAVRAALAVRDAVTALNTEQPELELRIRGAVNTGEAVVTLSARPALGEAMVAGDVVNTASRLQQHAPVGEIVVGEETYRATRSAIEYEPLEAVTAKGKATPLEAWRAVAATSATGERHLSSTPFVGRSREVDLLAATWERVELERRPHLITVLGPPGVGKSRLTVEFTAEVIAPRAVGSSAAAASRIASAARTARSRCRSRTSPASSTATASTSPSGSCARRSPGSWGRSRPRPSPGTSRSCSASRRRRPRPTATASSSRSTCSSRRWRATRRRRSSSRTSTGPTLRSST